MSPKPVLISLLLIPLLMGAQTVVSNPDTPSRGTWSFSPDLVWETDRIGERFLPSSLQVALGADGSVYLFDNDSFEISRFSSSGTWEKSFGHKGEGPGKYRFVLNMDEVGPHLAVTDMGGIHLFSHQGTYQKTLNGQGDMEAYLEDKGLLCTHEEDQKLSLILHPLDDAGDTLLDTAPPTRMLTATAGGLRLSVGDTSVVPMLLTHSLGHMVVWGHSETCLWTVANLKSGERFRFSIEGRNRPRIPESFKKNRFSGLKVNGQKLGNGMLRQLTQCIPDEGPYFTRVLLHQSGLILVFPTDYSEGRTSCEMELFSPSGHYLYRAGLKLPNGRPLSANRVALKGNRLVVLTENEEEDPVVAVYTLNLPPIPKS